MARNIPQPSEQVKELVEEIKARTRVTAYAMTIRHDCKPTLFDSKFGGLPYWDLSQPYPTDSHGDKLMFLAQINFDRDTFDEPLPQGGMLQFFIHHDDAFGADFNAPTKQDTFRVVYHKVIDSSLTLEQIEALEVPTCASVDYAPVCGGEFAVSIQKGDSFIGTGCCNFDRDFTQLLKEEIPDAEGNSWQSILSDTDREYVYQVLFNEGHRMLGYPCFAQSDPREIGSYYDTLLFQMDSDFSRKEDYILWGDCGIANFFINREALKRCDFSDVLYHWDCC